LSALAGSDEGLTGAQERLFTHAMAKENGFYNAATDGLYSGSLCFVVLVRLHPTPPAPVPATTPPGILLLIALLALAGVIVMGVKE